MADAPARDRVRKRLGDVLLPDEILEPPGTVLSGQDQSGPRARRTLAGRSPGEVVEYGRGASARDQTSNSREVLLELLLLGLDDDRGDLERASDLRPAEHERPALLAEQGQLALAHEEHRERPGGRGPRRVVLGDDALEQVARHRRGRARAPRGGVSGGVFVRQTQNASAIAAASGAGSSSSTRKSLRTKPVPRTLSSLTSSSTPNRAVTTEAPGSSGRPVSAQTFDERATFQVAIAPSYGDGATRPHAGAAPPPLALRRLRTRSSSCPSSASFAFLRTNSSGSDAARSSGARARAFFLKLSAKPSAFAA